MPALPSPNPPASAAGQPWYARLPIRTWQIVLAPVAGVLLLMLIFYAFGGEDRSRPEYVLKVLGEIHSREDLERDADYFTPTGKKLYGWVVEKRGNRPLSDSKDVYSQPIISGDICDIPVRSEDGTISGSVRLLKTDHWRFNDMYLKEAEGKEVGIWLSYVKDHPYATAWMMLWK